MLPSPEKNVESDFHDFLSRERERLAGGARPSSLYHYTSAAKDIMRSRVLRAYNLGQMNDFAEGRYGASVLRAHLDRGYAVEPDARAAELFSIMRRDFAVVDLSDVFVLSLTTDGNEAGMWRLYADQARGFSLGVHSQVVEKWCQDLKGVLWRCSYDYQCLMYTCVRLLECIRRLFLGEADAGRNPNPEEFSQLFFREVRWFGPVFKPHAWHDEQEWRLVFMRSEADHKNAEDGTRKFIELSLDAGEQNSPIAAICAGPSCSPNDIDELQDILRASRHANCPILTPGSN